MRQILHPGPIARERTKAVAGAAVALRFLLEPGQAVDATISRGFAAAGCLGGFVMLESVVCEPLAYVMPADAPDAEHVAWYSETFRPAGPVAITEACAIVGQRDGRPFLHCHGLWETAEGRRMGHLLAPDSIVARPAQVVGIGVRDATFEGRPDPETNFTLFEPIAVRDEAQEPAGPFVVLAKVRPNEDICGAIARICARAGVARAAVHGIGSLNGVRFADGGRIEAHATEVLIREGSVEGHRVHLPVDVVDREGAIGSGVLVPGDNPVCITFEFVIEPRDGAGEP